VIAATWNGIVTYVMKDPKPETEPLMKTRR
jgi:hypothetical protein